MRLKSVGLLGIGAVLSNADISGLHQSIKILLPSPSSPLNQMIFAILSVFCTFRTYVIGTPVDWLEENVGDRTEFLGISFSPQSLTSSADGEGITKTSWSRITGLR